MQHGETIGLTAGFAPVIWLGREPGNVFALTPQDRCVSGIRHRRPRCFDTPQQASTFSQRHSRPSFASPTPSSIRGRRECRALRKHPQPRMQMKKAHEQSHHRSTGSRRHSPRDGFNGFLRALSGDRAFLSPSPVRCASIVTDLTPASRRQDHTTSPSTASPLVSWRHRVHRIPRPTFVTIAIRPSYRARDGASF